MISGNTSSTKQIQEAILSLSDAERISIINWLIQIDRKIWDSEIETDFSENGPGSKLLAQIKKDFKSGCCTTWD
ncbi:MAG: hypothetical protein EHM30_09565 [Desulfobacteraceae bacterium]|nr:MAG: hypothetical protein EHM30_09565 [Desulfobacteraceae bacterium]